MYLLRVSEGITPKTIYTNKKKNPKPKLEETKNKCKRNWNH